MKSTFSLILQFLALLAIFASIFLVFITWKTDRFLRKIARPSPQFLSRFRIDHLKKDPPLFI